MLTLANVKNIAEGCILGKESGSFGPKLAFKKRKLSYFLFFARKAITEQKAPVFLSYSRAVFSAEAAGGAGTGTQRALVPQTRCQSTISSSFMANLGPPGS